MMEQVKENCKILGVPFSDEYLTNARKRAGLTMRVKNLIKKNESVEKPKPKKEEPKFPIKKLISEGNKYALEDSDIKVIICISEGLTFEDGAGTRKQIPEITFTLKRDYDFGGAGVNQIAGAMRNGMRPITKTASSVFIDSIKKDTVYPDSFEMAVENIEKNYRSRIIKHFKFDVDLSVLNESRLKKIFERAYSGTRLLTLSTEIK